MSEARSRGGGGGGGGGGGRGGGLFLGGHIFGGAYYRDCTVFP